MTTTKRQVLGNFLLNHHDQLCLGCNVTNVEGLTLHTLEGAAVNDIANHCVRLLIELLQCALLNEKKK